MLRRASAAQAEVKRATRAAFGATLVELANEGKKVCAVDADLSCSTTTAKLVSAGFADRFFNAGIAEQNMVGVAAGLSLTGYIPFTGSFAVFGTGRAYDQIRNTVCYSRLNVKIAPTHAGFSVGADGGSHQMLEDIALMRVLPNMRVLVPADYAAAAAAIRLAAETPGPMYVRLGRSNVASIYDEEGAELKLGGSQLLREGGDVTIIACGVMVDSALKASEQLAAKGIDAELIDAYSIKPLDEDAILNSVKKTGCALSIEEHSVIGGLGAAVSDLLMRNYRVPLDVLGVRDRFGKSGSFEELIAYLGLDTASIVNAVEKLISSKHR